MKTKHGDFFCFIIGVLTVWVWLPCLIIGLVVMVFVKAGREMIGVGHEAKDELVDKFASKLVQEHLIGQVVEMQEKKERET